MTISQILHDAENHQRSGQLDKAEALFQQAVSNSASNADALYGLGTLLLQRRQFKEALPHLEMAVSLQPGIPEFLFNLALAEKGCGLIERCKSTLEAAAEIVQSDIHYLLPICKLLIELGHARPAFFHLQNCNDKSIDLSLWKTRAQGAIGDWAGALRTLKQLALAVPGNSEVWQQYSKAAAYLRDYETAINAYQNYIDSTKASAADYLRFADLYLLARLPDEALTAIEKAFSMGIEGPEAYLIAAKCARLKGDNDSVKTNLRKALELRKTFGEAWQLLAEASSETELPGLAVEIQKAINNQSSTKRDLILLNFTAGRIGERLGEYEKAFAAFLKGNAEHKTLMAEKNCSYAAEATSDSNTKIIRCFPARKTFSEPVEIGQDADTKDASAQKSPLFILGMPRSGTTLVERMLACLDGVGSSGENEAIEFIAQQYYWDLANGRAPMPDELKQKNLEQMAEDYWKRTATEAPFVTDKMPHNFRHTGLICQIFPKALIIYMKRNPLDVCLSIYSRLFPDGHRYACDFDWLAHFYAESERLKAHWLEVFPDRILEVIYEDLVENPADKTQEIAEFCGLAWQPACLDFHTEKSNSFTFSELQVRKPLNRDGIGRWRYYENALKPLEAALKKHGVL